MTPISKKVSYIIISLILNYTKHPLVCVVKSAYIIDQIVSEKDRQRNQKT